MVKSLQLIIFLSILSLTVAQNFTNYREELIQKYPGYGTEFIFIPDENGKPIQAYLTKSNRAGKERLFGFGDYDVKKDVNYTYFSRSFPEGKPIFQNKDFQKYVDKNKPTKFVTHGWMSDGKRDSCSKIKDGFLTRYDANVIVMDWSAISKNLMYPIPMMATWDVGKEYSESINYLIDDVGVKPENIHLVGHSLGAHVSGFAGRNVRGGKVGRITGLDPALPGFDVGVVEGKSMRNTDANFVDIIHTCAGYLGYKTPIGHADFYPNGGQPPQPGCTILEFVEACSHGRSWKIFASSLFQDSSYMASKCPNMQQAMDRKKCEGEGIPIGDPTPREARGIYYTDIPRENLMITRFDPDSYL